MEDPVLLSTTPHYIRYFDKQGKFYRSLTSLEHYNFVGTAKTDKIQETFVISLKEEKGDNLCAIVWRKDVRISHDFPDSSGR